MRKHARSAVVLMLVVAAWADRGLAVTVTRGPFLQLQTPTSASVVWMTDTACTGEVEWGPTSSYGHLAQSALSATRHEIAVTGLLPDTLYHYRIRLEGTALSTDATFRTAPPDSASAVSFCFVGDSCSAPSNCTKTYNAMLPQSPNGFCVTLGDLAGRGEDNITDYWKTHFFTPAAAFVKQITMYPAVGNHELYDEDSYPDFVYPTKYLANWSLPTGSSGTEFYYSFDKGPVHLVSLDTWYTSFSTGSTQCNWLSNDLAASSKPWKIVYAHTGPYISELGSSDGSSTARSALVPILRQRGVDLYLHGHYHDYQRNLVNGITYVVQGTGGQGLTNRADDSQSYVQAYTGGEYCFTRLDITGNRLIGRCLRTSDATVLDGYQIDKTPIEMPWRDAFPATGPDLNWIAPWNFSTQCGVTAHANPSGDGYVFSVADTAGHQLAYPMLSSEALANYAMQAHVYYDNSGSVKNRFGIGLRGQMFFDTDKRSGYVLAFVRNDTLAADGHCVLYLTQASTETVLADWAYADTAGWHWLKLEASGSSLSVWIDGVNKTETPITTSAEPKGRPFLYNYRADGTGAKTLADDVAILPPGTGSLTIIQQPQAQAVPEGETAMFSVGAVGMGALTYRWQKNQSNLDEGGHYSGATTATLTVFPVDGTDVGNYRCAVTDAGGSLHSNEAALTITEPPAAPADFDHDRDVDQSDFGHLQKCLTAFGAVVSDPNCRNADLNEDDLVDRDDFAIFQACYSGANHQADHHCAD